MVMVYDCLSISIRSKGGVYNGNNFSFNYAFCRLPYQKFWAIIFFFVFSFILVNNERSTTVCDQSVKDVLMLGESNSRVYVLCLSSVIS